MVIIEEGFKKAKKNYNCDGWVWLEDFVVQCGLEKCAGIQKGDKYWLQVHTYSGVLNRFKCCKVCYKNANDHDIAMNDWDY